MAQKRSATEMEVDVDVKTRGTHLKQVIEMAYFLAKKFKLFPNDTIPERLVLETNNHLAGIVSSVYHAMRKLNNPKKAKKTSTEAVDKMKKMVARANNIEINVVDLANELHLGICKDMDYMRCTPLVDLLTAHKLIFDETRFGCAKFVVGKNDKKEDIKENIKTFGLNQSHYGALFGITLPPERTSGFNASLGVGTLAIMMLREKEFKAKAKKNLINGISYCELAHSIGNSLDNAKPKDIESFKGALKALSLMVLAFGERNPRKTFS